MHGWAFEHFTGMFVNDVLHLHDAQIQWARQMGAVLLMHLHGDLNGGLREFFLHYSSATHCTRTGGSLERDGSYFDRDIMLHETTINLDGSFNQTFLFAGGELLSIDFADLRVDLVDHPLL